AVSLRSPREAEQLNRELRPPRIGDPHLDPMRLELVMDEAGAGHRLDHHTHPLAEQTELAGKARQPIPVRTDRPLPTLGTIGPDSEPVQPLATQISSHVQLH